MRLTKQQKRDTEKWTRTKGDPHAVENGCWFDLESADHVVQFFENHLRHSKGRWAKQPFRLLKWQKEDILMPLFGWKRNDAEYPEDCSRRFRTGYIEVPKKNGKSTMGSGIALYLLIGDCEEGAEVYSAATTRYQAGIVFDEAANMCQKSPDLAGRVHITRSKKNISFQATLSKYEALSAEAGANEGLNIHGLIFDELHALKDRAFWDALRYGGASRTQPLILAITTAGYDRQSVCYESHSYAKNILEGSLFNDASFAYIKAADENDDWTDPDVWYKANPSLGDTINLESYRDDFNEAMDSKIKENIFKRYRLNMWTSTEEKWLDLEKWQACQRKIDLVALKGKQCWGGLDLGKTSDLTSLCLLFPEEVKTDSDLTREAYTALWWFWVPRETAKKRDKKDRLSYLAWAQNGFIELTEGDETDYKFVRRRINEIGKQYSIVDLAVDRLFQGAQLSQELKEEDGFDMVPFGQGFYSMAAPTEHWETIINRGEIWHDQNPVMDWMIGNVCVKQNEAGCYKPDKQRSGEKIDGVVAGIMALGRIMARERKTGSVYDERGVIFL